jgi:hypothetical protein
MPSATAYSTALDEWVLWLLIHEMPVLDHVSGAPMPASAVPTSVPPTLSAPATFRSPATLVLSPRSSVGGSAQLGGGASYHRGGILALKEHVGAPILGHFVVVTFCHSQ